MAESEKAEIRPTEETEREGTVAPKTPRKFGTFGGVFVPTLLTILGVIMYLREGWVIGQAGLLGACIIIIMSFAITGCTGLSMSSVTTNIRMGAGGAYSIISQSLGIEIGGAVGIPLYTSQTLAVVMYIFGFRAGWLYIFPQHPPILVDLILFLALFGIAFVSAGLAFRIQYLILAIIIASLVSIAVAASRGSMQYDVVWRPAADTGAGALFGAGFWPVFAVFFPAATGIMAGANMSGDLKDPRKSIPLGTLGAIGLSLVIYLLLAYWLVRSATMEELRENYTIMIDKAAWGPAVLAGLLGATFSSALASLVGAPRILQALGQHKILPRGDWFATRTQKGEPRNALFLTGAIVIIGIMLRDLNAVAPLITMFFLITYATINLVVYMEQRLGLVSFRPLLRVPRIVPLIGTVGCVLVMIIINPVFSLIALAIVVVFYFVLIRRHLDAPYGDVRSGAFVALAEWAAKKVAHLPENRERGWKPNLLVPVQDPPVLRGAFRLLHSLAYPRGSVKVVGITAPDQPQPPATQRLNRLAQAFREERVFSSWTHLESEPFEAGILTTIQALGGVFFRPNLLLLSLPPDSDGTDEESLAGLAERAPEFDLGSLLFAEHMEARLGRRATVNVWLPDAGPDWELKMELGDADLEILLAYKLKRNWQADLRLIARVTEEEEAFRARAYLDQLMDLARLPSSEAIVLTGELDSALSQSPLADLHFFPLPAGLDNCAPLARRRDALESSCVFVRAAGPESALA